ncbi:hypothetical protein BDZ45DRAFT_752644 [Acephala macrosclerotiorum]|nr:hypothetical protein BDZ45DRAFT_752644 [Acephala macrosclerotiorum]
MNWNKRNNGAKKPTSEPPSPRSEDHLPSIESNSPTLLKALRGRDQELYHRLCATSTNSIPLRHVGPLYRTGIDLQNNRKSRMVTMSQQELERTSQVQSSPPGLRRSQNNVHTLKLQVETGDNLVKHVITACPMFPKLGYIGFWLPAPGQGQEAQSLAWRLDRFVCCGTLAGNIKGE